MSVDWSYFDKFDGIINKYLPMQGEGETKATQIVTAVNKLVYKWYNDGDVFDNSYAMEGWANDLSSYANWLYHNTKAEEVLDKISGCLNDSDYEELLKELADVLLDEEYLAEKDKVEKVGTIYDCNGKFKFVEVEEEDDDYCYDDEEDEEEYY